MDKILSDDTVFSLAKKVRSAITNRESIIELVREIEARVLEEIKKVLPELEVKQSLQS